MVGAFQGSAKLAGFYVQEDQAGWDADPATSEGLFVFDSNFGVPVQVGDRVRVQGRVAEFGTAGATLTELSNVANVLVCSQGHAFPFTTVTLPVPSVATWERYEGMAVRIESVLTVTETFNLGSFGEVVLATARLDNPTNLVDPGPDAIALQALNDRSRIIVDDGSNLSRQNLDPAPFPENGGLAAGDPNRTVRVGDRVNVSTPLRGVLDQRFGTYRLQPTSPLVFNPPDNPRLAQPPAVGGRVRVASFNVLNYFTTLDVGNPVCGPTGGLDCRGANSAAEFTRQRDKIISALVALNGHVVGLIELENNAQRLAAGSRRRPQRRHPAGTLRVHQHGHDRHRRHQGGIHLPAGRRHAGGDVRRPRRLARPAGHHDAEPAGPGPDLRSARDRARTSSASRRS